MNIQETKQAIFNNKDIQLNKFISLRITPIMKMDKDEFYMSKKVDIVFGIGNIAYVYQDVPESTYMDVRKLALLITRFVEDCFERIKVLCNTNIMKGVFTK